MQFPLLQLLLLLILLLLLFLLPQNLVRKTDQISNWHEKKIIMPTIILLAYKNCFLFEGKHKHGM